MSLPQDFFVELEGAVDGPMSGIEVRELALKGKVTPETRIGLSQAGESKLRWFPARRLSGLFDAAGKPLPHPPLTQAYMKGASSARDSSSSSLWLTEEVVTRCASSKENHRRGDVEKFLKIFKSYLPFTLHFD